MSIVISGNDFLVKQGIAAIVERMGETPGEALNGTIEGKLFIGVFDDGNDPVLDQVASVLKTTPVLLVGEKFHKTDITRLINLGVKNIVTKRCSEEEIENAIRFSIDGQRFYCSSVLETLTLPVSGNSDVVNSLSKREKEVLKHVLEGKTSSQIAEDLFVSLHTVNSHRKNILKKFQLKSPAELLIYAIEHDIRKFLEA